MKIYDLVVTWKPANENEENFSLKIEGPPGLTLIDGLNYLRQNCSAIQETIIESKRETENGFDQEREELPYGES